MVRGGGLLHRGGAHRAPAGLMDERVVGVVVPNYDGWPLLEECLATLLAAPLPGHRLDVVVVDNASSDGSREKLAAAWPGVRLIANAANRGFTPAINQGVAATGGEWVLLLNNDVALPPAALARLLAVAEAGPAELGGVQPLLVQAGRPGQIDSAGIGVRSRFRTHDILMGQPVERAPREVTEIWGACAGCVLVRRRALEEAGGFDEQFFVELDDVDFAFRARWLGYHFLLVPDARGRHHRQSNEGHKTVRKLLWVRRNGLWIVMKNVPPGMDWPLLAYRAQRDLLMTAHYLRRGQAGAVARAWGQAFRAWPGMRRKRRATLAAARRTPAEMRADLARFAAAGEPA